MDLINLPRKSLNYNTTRIIINKGYIYGWIIIDKRYVMVVSRMQIYSPQIYHAFTFTQIALSILI